MAPKPPHVDNNASLPAGEPHVVAAVVDVLQAGGVALVPTETVYGIAALPSRAAAVDRLYALKERPRSRRLPIAVSNLDQVRTIGLEVTEEAHGLMVRYWPGPLTLALGFAVDAKRPPWLADRDEAAVRSPDHPLLLAVLDQVGPLLLTSANRHGADAPHTLREALASLGQRPDVVVDGGPLPGLASTVVNVNLAQPVVEREGPIALALESGTLATEAAS